MDVDVEFQYEGYRVSLPGSSNVQSCSTWCALYTFHNPGISPTLYVSQAVVVVVHSTASSVSSITVVETHARAV